MHGNSLQDVLQEKVHFHARYLAYLLVILVTIEFITYLSIHWIYVASPDDIVIATYCRSVLSYSSYKTQNQLRVKGHVVMNNNDSYHDQ